MTEHEVFTDKLDRCKRLAPDGSRYWMARDIQPLLGYGSWDKFLPVIDRAMAACSSAGVDVVHQFSQTGKMVNIGSGARVERSDYFLSRYGCYLIAMNGETSKKEVGYAQTYFAVQTRKQELQDRLTEHERRALQRERVRDANRKLGTAAKNANVQRYAIFHDAGYKQLYAGLGMRRGIKKNGRASRNRTIYSIVLGRVELAMNEFRITQAEAKIVREKANTEQQAIRAHEQVGAEVRRAVGNMGGVMPENLPAEPNINKLVSPKRRKELAEMATRTTPAGFLGQESD